MELQALAGNEALKRQLDLQTAGRGLSHAYIISGPAGSGKHTLAGLMTAALVCSSGGDKLPCGRCSGCRKAMSGIHPDVSRVGDDGKDISVQQVRTLRSDSYIRPNEASRKVYVLEHAERMNPSAQNAMLKLLEEGPPYAAFLLLTENASALLPTVRSRCEQLSLSPLTPEETLRWLRERYPDRRDLAETARRCEGVLGRAVAELEGGEALSELQTTARELVRLFSCRDELALSELCITLEKWDRERFSALMDETILLLRDALLTQAGVAVSGSPQVPGLSSRAMLEAVSVLQELRSACGFNVGTGHLAGWLCARLASIMNP